MYKIVKCAAIYRVMCGNVIVFSSMRRKNCEDFINANTPKETTISAFNACIVA